MTDWNSFDLVLAAVQQNGYALNYAEDSLKANEKIVLAAVKQNGFALKYADESLKNNEIFLRKLDSLRILKEECVSARIKNEIEKDPNYLLNTSQKNQKAAVSRCYTK